MLLNVSLVKVSQVIEIVFYVVVYNKRDIFSSQRKTKSNIDRQTRPTRGNLMSGVWLDTKSVVYHETLNRDETVNAEK